jgi:2-oxoglutarate dehydrogenase E1 component
VLDDDEVGDRGAVRRLLLCSGKVFYALRAARRERGQRDVALVRVEQLYPFPAGELRAVVATLPRLERALWVQEEPRNMGAWRNLQHRFRAALPENVELDYAGRDSRAVPATGSYEVHVREEKDLVEAALGEDRSRRIVRRDPTPKVTAS